MDDDGKSGVQSTVREFEFILTNRNILFVNCYLCLNMLKDSGTNVSLLNCVKTVYCVIEMLTVRFVEDNSEF